MSTAASIEGLPRLHLLVSDAELDRADRRSALETLLERRAPIAVHLRTRQSAADLFASARELVVAGGRVFVNGRPDVALAAAARGVQLGSTALEVADARAVVDVCGGDLEIGVSVHAEGEARDALAGGADILVLGTIFPTPSHPGDPGQGTGIVNRVSARSTRPVLAIGGVDASRIPDVLRAGAYGAVVSSAVWDAPEPVRAAETLLDVIERWLEPGKA